MSSDYRRQYSIFKIDTEFIIHSAVRRGGDAPYFEIDMEKLEKAVDEAKRTIGGVKINKRVKSRINEKSPIRITTADSIAFSQICEYLNFTIPADSEGQPLNMLEKHIVFVEFSEYRHTYDGFESRLKREAVKKYDPNGAGARNYSESSFNMKKPAEYIFSNGFKIKFGGETVEFVRFEKSQSMAKNCVMAFINKDIEKEIRKRVTLNLEDEIKKSNMPVRISKWHAYKGLALTGAVAVDLKLNENRVIVVKDGFIKGENVAKENIEIITARKKRGENGKTVEHTGADGRKMPEYELEKIGIKDGDINKYDGTGLISAECAGEIERQLSGNDNRKMTSFQIRLAFIKGMVHKVDFKEFFIKELGLTEIKDRWGISRKVADADIILTESQFKAAGWFDAVYAENSWGKYWEKFELYNHRLFIVQYNKTDEERGEDDTVSYQVLSTLRTAENQFEELLNYSMHTYSEIKGNYLAQLINFGLSEDEITKNNRKKKTLDGYDLYAEALKQNPKFIREAKIKDVVSNGAEDMLQKIRIGQFIIKGKTRFLAPDLLGLLYHIADPEHKDENIREKKRKERFIGKNFFYAPGIIIDDKTQNELSLTRNPHISRNEHVTARLWMASRESNLYKYFRHLDAVCMINPVSCIPDRLGGADYDGDMVKIIDNPSFVKAAGHNLPLIDIPKTGNPADLITDAAEWNTVENTFNSRVGMLSNYAFGIASEAYNEKSGSEQERRNAEEDLNLMTILIGLDIDSAKTGEKPFVPKRLRNKKTSFLMTKEHIENYGYYIRGQRQPETESNLNRLQDMINDGKKRAAAVKTMQLEELLDGAKLDGAKLTPEQKNRMSALFIAYNELASEYYNGGAQLRRRALGPIMDILENQGKLDEFGEEELNIVEICEEIFSEASLDNLFLLLRRQHEELWAFTEKEERESVLSNMFREFNITAGAGYRSLFLDFNFSGYDLLGYFIQLEIDMRKEKSGAENSKSIPILKKNEEQSYKIMEKEFKDAALLKKFREHISGNIFNDAQKIKYLESFLKEYSGEPDIRKTDKEKAAADRTEAAADAVAKIMGYGEDSEIYKILLKNAEFQYSPLYFAVNWIIAKYKLIKEEEFRDKLFKPQIKNIEKYEDLKEFRERRGKSVNTVKDFINMYKERLAMETAESDVFGMNVINKNCRESAAGICKDEKTLVGAFMDKDIVKLEKSYNRSNQFFWICAGKAAVENNFIEEYRYKFPKLDKENGNYDYMYRKYKTEDIKFAGKETGKGDNNDR